MLGYSVSKALICRCLLSMNWSLSLCLGSMATGSCSQHMSRFKISHYGLTSVEYC